MSAIELSVSLLSCANKITIHTDTIGGKSLALFELLHESHLGLEAVQIGNQEFLVTNCFRFTDHTAEFTLEAKDESARKILRSGVYDISTYVRARWFAGYTVETSGSGHDIPLTKDYWRIFDTEAEAKTWLQERLESIAANHLKEVL